MSEQEKIALLEETLETDEGVLSADSILEELEEYDSMSKLALIVMFQDEFSVTITGDDIKAFRTIGDILAKMG